MWELVIRVYRGLVEVAILRTKISMDSIVKELFVGDIKFYASADNQGVTVSSFSGSVELGKQNSYYSGMMSEPSLDADTYAGMEYTWKAESTIVKKEE